MKIKSKSIKNYLQKHRDEINMTLETKGFEPFKELLIQLLLNGLHFKEITDEKEANMLLESIPNMGQSQLYSTYVTLITCLPVGKYK